MKTEDAVLREAVAAFGTYGSKARAAEALEIPRTTLIGRLNVAKARGIEVEVSSSIEKPKVSGAESQIEILDRNNTILQDRINSLNARLKDHHRVESLFDALCDEMHKIVVPLSPLPGVPERKKTAEHVESLVVHLSDEHADQVIEPHRVGGLECYNLKVALARAEKFVDGVISLSQRTLLNYKFPELWILAYGDHVSGEIHDSTSHSEFRNVFDNAIAVGQMHALMIRDLAPYFDSVKILYLPGNHGRRTPKKDYRGPKDNWDYLVGRTAEMLCVDIDNVEFLLPDSGSYTFEINGWNFCAFHGDDIKSWNSIPHYGIERKTRRLSAVHSAQGRQIHYFVMGHFHSRSTTEHPAGEVLMNGTWCATDEYAYEALGLVTRPSQLLHGVCKTYGVSFRFPIYLKFPGDTAGPSRYVAPLKSLGHMMRLEKRKQK